MTLAQAQSRFVKAHVSLLDACYRNAPQSELVFMVRDLCRASFDFGEAERRDEMDRGDWQPGAAS